MNWDDLQKLAMRGQQLLPGLFDPTGITFEQPKGYFSSELNGVEIGPDGKWRMYPSLVPGQVGLESILAGNQLTPEQMKIAFRYAMSRANEVPTFNTQSDAEDYEKRRHKQLDLNYPPAAPEDIISSLYQLMGQQR